MAFGFIPVLHQHFLVLLFQHMPLYAILERSTEKRWTMGPREGGRVAGGRQSRNEEKEDTDG